MGENEGDAARAVKAGGSSRSKLPLCAAKNWTGISPLDQTDRGSFNGRLCRS